MAATTSSLVRLVASFQRSRAAVPTTSPSTSVASPSACASTRCATTLASFSRVLLVPAREQCAQEGPRTGLLTPRGNLEPGSVASVRSLAPTALHEATCLAHHRRSRHFGRLRHFPLSNREKSSRPRVFSRQVSRPLLRPRSARPGGRGRRPGRGSSSEGGRCRRTRRGPLGSSAIPTRPRRTG